MRVNGLVTLIQKGLLDKNRLYSRIVSRLQMSSQHLVLISNQREHQLRKSEQKNKTYLVLSKVTFSRFWRKNLT